MVRLAPMRRLAPLTVLLALTIGLAGCGLGGVSSGEETSALPETVVGTVKQAPAVTAGDPEQGKTLYTANGCGGCHAFAPAGSSGTVGPKLDDLVAAAKTAGQPLDAYVAESIRSPGSFVVKGYTDGVMPPYAQLTSEQVGDLVAFLTKPGN